jgi:hypothetical protein
MSVAEVRRITLLGHWPLNVLLIVIATRIAYGLLGLGFDSTTFPGYMQFIDRELLASRLLESIWYLHAQPPLLNLFAGIGIKLFGTQADSFFAAGFHVLGFALGLAVFKLADFLTGSRPAAYAATVLVVASPAFVLYENWLMYTLPSSALLAAAGAALCVYSKRGTTYAAIVFFSLLAALALTRSLFHLAWLVGIAGLLTAAFSTRRRQIVLAACVPVLLVTAWYGKNYLYFGSFGASSLLGLSLSNITTLTVPREELLPLVMQERLSPFALVSRYTDTELLFSSQRLPPTGIPVLDAVRKSTGQYNYNNRQIIAINRFYTRDAITVAREFPFSYALGIAVANRLFFSPSSMNEYFSDANRAAVAAIEPWFNRLLYGARAEPRYLVQPHFGLDREPSLEVNTGYGLILAWLLVLPYTYLKARREFLDRGSDGRARAIVAGFMLLNILYVYATATLLELGENYRYKFLIEPLFTVLLVAAVTDLLRRAKPWLRRSGAAD